MTLGMWAPARVPDRVPCQSAQFAERVRDLEPDYLDLPQIPATGKGAGPAYRTGRIAVRLAADPGELHHWSGAQGGRVGDLSLLFPR